MESRMPRDLVSTSVITQNYRVNGMISVTAAGLIGLLSDPTDSYIEIENASLVRLHRPQEIVAQFNTWGMVKSRVIAVLCEKTADLGRITIARAGFSRLISYRIWASLHGFEMFGILESPGKFDFSAQMFQGNRQFTSLFNATLIPVYFPQLVTRAPAILFNRQMVDGDRPVGADRDGRALAGRNRADPAHRDRAVPAHRNRADRAYRDHPAEADRHHQSVPALGPESVRPG
jgi:hypothetical protein